MVHGMSEPDSPHMAGLGPSGSARSGDESPPSADRWTQAFRWVAAAVLLGSLLRLGVVVAAALRREGDRTGILAGILMVGVADLQVYLLVSHGLFVDPSRFMKLWGLSLLGKIMFFGVTAAAVVGFGLVPAGPFLVALAVAFPVFTAHQVLCLVRLADAARPGPDE